MSGEPREVMVLPGNSWLPLAAGLLLAALCICLLLKAYGIALAAAGACVLVLLRWSWENGAYGQDAAAQAEDLPEGLRLHKPTFEGPGLWGMGLTLLADAALYASLIFAWLYLWTVAPNWQPPAASPIGVWPLGLAAVLVLTGWHVMNRGVRDLRQGEAAGLRLHLLMAGGTGTAAGALIAGLLAMAPLSPKASAHDAVIAFTLWFLLLHVAVTTVATLLQAWRAHAAHVGVDAPYEPNVVRMLWQFTGVAMLVAWVALYLLPCHWRRAEPCAFACRHPTIPCTS